MKGQTPLFSILPLFLSLSSHIQWPKGNATGTARYFCWRSLRSQAETDSGKPAPFSCHPPKPVFQDCTCMFKVPSSHCMYIYRDILSMCMQWKSYKNHCGIKGRKETEACDWVPSFIHKHLHLTSPDLFSLPLANSFKMALLFLKQTAKICCSLCCAWWCEINAQLWPCWRELLSLFWKNGATGCFITSWGASQR